jgi:hypothetical protein
MKIYQPMLFVGLGGTGCRIGAELERCLRDELCGPDGTNLQTRIKGSTLAPFQLPSCVQFVYADLNDAELDKVPRLAVPADEHRGVVERTAHFVRNLVPQHNTYPEVARSLRTNAGEYVRDWLPPIEGEPRVAPLARGAGQLPTVGRAALFETLRFGPGPAQAPVDTAIGAISKSGAELRSLGGTRLEMCDVFVAFSVAGGTGGGIFYDYLHLIGQSFDKARFRAQIYPLVLMPSAFDEGEGGGRNAVLNGGRALLDLFRLVDDQNGQAAHTDLNGLGTSGRQLGVRYPAMDGEVRLRPSTAQTAFLFSRTPGVEREDLHRSVVSLMLSLLGTGLEGDDALVRPSDRLYQSFADDFINRGVEREVVAVSGIGNRGVSTSLVASMTVPVDDLADIVSSRLLAKAVEELAVAPPGAAESNRPLIQTAFSATNLEPLRARSPVEFTEPPAAQGASAVVRALHARAQLMEDALDALDAQLRAQVPDLARGFDYRRGVETLLGEADLFRVKRVLLGDTRLAEPIDRMGFVGVLEGRRVEPDPPRGLGFKAPAPRPVQGRLGGLIRVKWSDRVVQYSLQDQDNWYRWRTHRAWNRAWSDQAPQWDRAVAQLRREITTIADAFVEHARADAPRFLARTRDLYRPRTGVSYLLPPHGDLEPFYDRVVRRFVSQHRLRPVAGAADILFAILGQDGWRNAYRIGYEVGPAQAVMFVRSAVKREVKRLFVQAGDAVDERPLLPALAHLLLRAAGGDGPPVADDDLAQFRQKLAGMLPGGFSPQGTGPLKVLVGYAAAGKDAQVERYLSEQVQLPREARATSPGGAPGVFVEYRPLDTESIVVVLFRTSMSITEVPELRSVLHQWAEALRTDRREDYLAWRQRLGYGSGWLITTEEHRVQILHRILCAMWNSQVHVLEGEAASPSMIRISLRADEAVAMTLQLRRFGEASSWGDIVRAYEEWTIADDQEIRRDFCERLMDTRPTGLDATPVPPSDLFVDFVHQIWPEQRRALAVMREDMRRVDARRSWTDELCDFWTDTVRSALELRFTSVAIRRNLLGLDELAQR